MSSAKPSDSFLPEGGTRKQIIHLFYYVNSARITRFLDVYMSSCHENVKLGGLRGNARSPVDKRALKKTIFSTVIRYQDTFCSMSNIAKMLTASDGKIPYLQILIGVAIGVIGMFFYAKFCRPKILFEETSIALDPVAANDQLLAQTATATRMKAKAVPAPVHAQTNASPVLLDIRTLVPNEKNMPKLPMEELTEDETEDEEDEDEQLEL
jgi:hypothetical protein